MYLGVAKNCYFGHASYGTTIGKCNQQRRGTLFYGDGGSGKSCFEWKSIGGKFRWWRYLIGSVAWVISCRRCKVCLFLFGSVIDEPFLLESETGNSSYNYCWVVSSPFWLPKSIWVVFPLIFTLVINFCMYF